MPPALPDNPPPAPSAPAEVAPHASPFRAEGVCSDRAALAAAGMIVPDGAVTPLAEEFRQIKRQLLLAARGIARDDARKARALLVCSANPGDGKTFCAINLALSLAAERDTHVLLVDADFAKPEVMTRLGLSEDRLGLLDALADTSRDVETLVVPTDVPQLSLLPAGTRTNADTELLASAQARHVLASLVDADPNRIVVFDSPPALAASPAAVLAGLVGQAMLVVRADRTSEGDLRKTVAQLDECAEVQLVLNAVALQPGRRRLGSYAQQGAEA